MEEHRAELEGDSQRSEGDSLRVETQCGVCDIGRLVVCEHVVRENVVYCQTPNTEKLDLNSLRVELAPVRDARMRRGVMRMEPTEAQDRIQGTWPIADHRVKREPRNGMPHDAKPA